MCLVVCEEVSLPREQETESETNRLVKKSEAEKGGGRRKCDTRDRERRRSRRANRYPILTSTSTSTHSFVDSILLHTYTRGIHTCVPAILYWLLYPRDLKRNSLLEVEGILLLLHTMCVRISFLLCYSFFFFPETALSPSLLAFFFSFSSRFTNDCMLMPIASSIHFCFVSRVLIAY